MYNLNSTMSKIRMARSGAENALSKQNSTFRSCGVGPRMRCSLFMWPVTAASCPHHAPIVATRHGLAWVMGRGEGKQRDGQLICPLRYVRGPTPAASSNSFSALLCKTAVTCRERHSLPTPTSKISRPLVGSDDQTEVIGDRLTGSYYGRVHESN